MNLLTEKEKQIVRQEFWWRCFEVVGIFGIVLLSVALLLLIPTFIYIRVGRSVAEDSLRVADQKLAVLEKDTETRALVTAVYKKIDILKPEDPALPEFFPLMRAILARTTSGVTIKAIHFDRASPDKGSRGKIVLNGIANNRKNFLTFVSSLESEPLFTKVVSPIENLVKDKNLEYAVYLYAR